MYIGMLINIKEVFFSLFFLWQGQLSLATACVKHKPEHCMILYKFIIFTFVFATTKFNYFNNR